jgi:sialate O-acetylesterase
MVRLLNLKAGGSPESFTVDGKNRIRFNNVLIGEVWICSGQSNMEWPLSRSLEPQEDIAKSDLPNIRLYTVPKNKASEPQADVKSVWLECKPVNTPWFSAVAFYFGRSLEQARKVPIGLIHTSWGGSPAEVWMSRSVLESNPNYLLDIIVPSDLAVKKHKDALAAYQEQVAALKREGKTATNQPPRSPGWVPSELFNGMINPIVPFGARGAIWYQGESNAGRAHQYRTLYPDMIKNWRTVWGVKDFTFLAVQLAPFKARKTEPGESDWAELREAQLLATKMPGVGMAVITDCGDEKDIHPKAKKPVGERLALLARGLAYREAGLVYSGPVYKSLSVKKDKAVLRFDHVGGGLVAKDGDLKGFAICGEDRKWVWAKAEITGKKDDEITVSHASVTKPVAVRYGWADFPEVNLFNKEGLPATPFRTDDFPMITQPKAK